MATSPTEYVVWRQGMLVTPQHLQQESRAHADRLDARLQAVAHLHWGVARLSIDAGALKSGQFRIADFSGVFPDGLPVSFGANDSIAPTPRAIEAHFSSTATVLEVYLGIPSPRSDVSAYGEGPDEKKRRYQIQNRSVRDSVNPDAEMNLSVAQPNLSILFGDEAKDHEAIKIAELTRDASGSFAESANYIAPSLHLEASHYLKQQVQDLLSILVVKARTLSDGLRQRDDASVEFSNRDITRFLMLNSFNQNIPVLRHISETPESSPATLYRQMIEFAGQLATFSVGVDSSTFPKFNHLDLRSSFEDLFSTIHSMLGTMVKDVCIPIPLEARADGMWIGQLKDDRLLKCKAYVLSIEVDEKEQEVANKLPRLSKIAAWKQISQIVRSAMPGVPLQPTHRPPPEVPVRPRQVYFLLSTSDEHWCGITNERTIALYLPPPYDPSRAKVSILGVPESK